MNYNCKDNLERLERVDVTDTYGFTVLQGSVILNWIPGFRVILEAGGQLTYSAKHSKNSLWKSPKWYQLLQVTSSLFLNTFYSLKRFIQRNHLKYEPNII